MKKYWEKKAAEREEYSDRTGEARLGKTASARIHHGSDGLRRQPCGPAICCRGREPSTADPSNQPHGRASKASMPRSSKATCLQPENLRSALWAATLLVHVAADYRLWVRDPQQMYGANVDGTRELLKLAREAGVQRVVYTSSVATMGFKADGTIVNEDTPVTLADIIGHYKRSKFLGEQEAIKAARAGQHVMILNPTTPIGSARRQTHTHWPHHRRLPQ